MCYNNIVLFAALLGTAVSVRINFTSCQNAEWSCTNNVPNDIVYTCSVIRSNDFIIHLKDFYTDRITRVTVQKCKDLKVVLDCPILQRASQLQRFKIKDCDKLEFVTLSNGSLLQTPPEVIIENVKDIMSIPKKMFKSPSTNTERKCLGALSMKRIRVANSKIHTIKTNAIYNVTNIRSVEFENVTIMDIKKQGIEAIMTSDNTAFKIINSRIENMELKSITTNSATVTIYNNTFGDILTNTLNITSDYLNFTANRFKQINANSFIVKSVNLDIKRNDINILKSNALSSVRCLRKRSSKKQFNFSDNKIVNVEPHSLVFDYSSCKAAGTSITIDNNKIDCRCRNIAFLNSGTNTELYSTILDVAYNNTCLSAPCILPVEIVKLLLESDMCRLNLDPQVMCLLYSDKHSNNEVTTDEDVTEPAPTLYLIRQANSPNGAPSAMTAVNKDDLLKGSHLNMTNRTAIKVVFDSSKDFVETLRSTSTSRRKPADGRKVTRNEEYVNRCDGPHCRNNVAYDKEKALAFYKYVYAQLRTPMKTNEEKKT